MHPVLDYIIKANALLIFFGLFYLIFLKRETFYQLNRWYFISCISMSLTAPLITFTKTVIIDPVPIELYMNDTLVTSNEKIKEPSFLETIDVQEVFVYLMLFISLILILRKIYAVAKLYYSIKKLPSLDNSNIKIIANNKTVYSFYKWIVVPENFFQWQNREMILNHENIHLNQKHTFDLVFIELVTAVFWFNPLLKIMQQNINSNLEFIVDQKMIEITEPILYQKNLLKFQTQNNIQFVNSYNASEIKNRILQLNSKKSTNMKKLKFLLATPVLVAFFFMFQIETEAQIKENIEVEELEDTSFLVRENFTKEDFSKLSKKLKEDFDIDLSVKNIKYDNNKIKSLDYVIRNKDYKISSSVSSLDKNIDPFLIVVNLNESEPFKVEKYAAKPTYSYTVDNEIDSNFTISEDEWKDGNWIKKISANQKVIYLIDDKKSSKGAAYTLNPKDILSINVHRDKETKEKFNEDVDNVVIIKTKKIKDVTNLEKDLELLLSDRKAFDRIAAKYPIYVDDVLMTKKQLKDFDTKNIRSMSVNENMSEIKLTTRKSENETFFFKIADDNADKPSDNILINGKESTEEELKIHINKINQKKDSLSSLNKIQVQNLKDKSTQVTIKGISSTLTQKTIYLVDGKEINTEDFRKIHPNDIESINVLKDKELIKIYGNKAKDGVLVIKTKAKKEATVQTNDGREFFDKLKKAAEKKKEEQEKNRLASIKQKNKDLKARELALKERKQIIKEQEKQISQLRKEREKQRQELIVKRNEISEKAQERRKELEKLKKEKGLQVNVNQV